MPPPAERHRQGWRSNPFDAALALDRSTGRHDGSVPQQTQRGTQCTSAARGAQCHEGGLFVRRMHGTLPLYLVSYSSRKVTLTEGNPLRRPH